MRSPGDNPPVGVDAGTVRIASPARAALLYLLVFVSGAFVVTSPGAARTRAAGPRAPHRAHRRHRCPHRKAAHGRHGKRIAKKCRGAARRHGHGATAGTTAGAPSASSTPAAGTATSAPTRPAAAGATTPQPVTTAPAPAPTDSLAGDSFYVNPYGTVQTEERSLLAQRDTSDAAQIETIASQPEAIWLTSDASATTANVQSITGAAASAGKVPVLVTYNIPWRDCGGASAGGASSAQDYEQYIDGIAAGVGQAKVVLIVEPDALGEIQCLPAAEQTAYTQLLQFAVQKLSSDAEARIYVDAGNPGWHPAAVMASRLAPVISGTRAGFSLNVSDYYATATDAAYGTAISQAVGGAHFIIDTSRNGGNAEKNQWCNAPGAGLGTAPTTDTGNRLIDADLWIKPPGESDGECNGGPAPGTFWLSYALKLIQNRG